MFDKCGGVTWRGLYYLALFLIVPNDMVSPSKPEENITSQGEVANDMTW
jgi:hypothetical protein